MRDYNDINIFDTPLEVSYQQALQDTLTSPSYVSQYIKTDDRDAYDKTIEGYEENVPFLAQVAAGFTPPGMAMDVAAAGKYGRDAYRDFKEGEIGEGFKNLGIAGLSGLAAIPLLGEIAAVAKKPLKSTLKSSKGIASLDDADPRRTLTRAQEDIFTGDVVKDAYKMHDRALRIGPEFNKQMDEIAANLNLTTTLPGTVRKIDSYTNQPFGTVKMPVRIVEKARTKTGGDVSNITDPIRTRIVINTPEEEEIVAKILAQNYKVFDKGRQIKPEGFVDRKLNIVFTGSNGETLIGEVGIITAPMWKAANKSHAPYEEFRSLFPKGMPSSTDELAKIGDDIVKKGNALIEEMDVIFKEAKDQIDPSFYEPSIKKFASGGYVTSGSSGSASPITPNLASKSVLDIFEPSTKKSATWLGSANVQSELPGDIKKPKYPAFTGFITAGPSSHVKYNLSINPSLQKFTKNYNPNDVDIFELE
jgi:hypothetical protein